MWFFCKQSRFATKSFCYTRSSAMQRILLPLEVDLQLLHQDDFSRKRLCRKTTSQQNGQYPAQLLSLKRMQTYYNSDTKDFLSDFPKSSPVRPVVRQSITICIKNLSFQFSLQEHSNSSIHALKSRHTKPIQNNIRICCTCLNFDSV